MQKFFQLQFLATNRKIKDFGLPPLVAYVLILAAFILFSAELFQKTDFAKYICIIICAGLQLKLIEKNRLDFLISVFGDSKARKIRIMENLIIGVPFFGVLIVMKNYSEAGILLLLSAGLAAISSGASYQISIPTPFSKRPFEFCVGFRRTYFLFPLAYGVTVVAIQADNLNLGLFAGLFISLICSSYYSKPEPDYFVWIHSDTPMAFLKNKILRALMNFALLLAPAVIALLIFYPSETKTILLVFLVGLLFLGTVILAKYSAYPNEAGLPEWTIIAVGIAFLPLLFVVIPYLFSNSIKNLKELLHDKN